MRVYLTGAIEYSPDHGKRWRAEVTLFLLSLGQADMGKRIIIAGLDTDYLGRPFHPIPELLAVADEITKTLAICMQCGNPENHTQRLVASEDLIVVGTSGMYEARCRRCSEPNLAHLPKPEPAVRATLADTAK
jgi:thymidine kinase-like protein